MEELNKYSTPESAVMRAVDDAGGVKRVGTTLRPEWEDAPDTAARWVHHCCEDSNRSKFGLRQIVWIFRTACKAGFHTGLQAFARLCGYRAEPIDELAQVRQMRDQAQAAFAAAQETPALINSLSPEQIALAQAINLNTEVMS